MSVAAAVIAAAGSIVGLAAVGTIYGHETAAFVDESIAQDIVYLAVVTPAFIVSALLAGQVPAACSRRLGNRRIRSSTPPNSGSGDRA